MPLEYPLPPIIIHQEEDAEEEVVSEALDSLTDLPSSVMIQRRQVPLRDGFLYALSDDRIWFRLYVALYPKHVDAYYNILDPMPAFTIHLGFGTKIVIPEKTTENTPDAFCFPLHITNKDSPPVFLAAESEEDREEWETALTNRTQACSLNIEGLNLEGCQTYGAVAEIDDTSALAQTLELLDELLKQKRDEGVRKTGSPKGTADDACSWMAVDDNQHASIMAHQEALRKATHLRQRKISTELKLETLRKQLRKPNKKSTPKVIPEEGPEGRVVFEEQLQELTAKLRALEGNLGQTEKEAQKTKREWDEKMEEVYRHLYDTTHILSVESAFKQWEQNGSKEDHSRSGRLGGGSLRVRAARLMSSPRSKKKADDQTDLLRSSNSSGSLKNEDSEEEGSGRESDHGQHMFRQGGSSKTQSTKSRRGPLRLLGSLLESHRGRFSGSYRRHNKSLERGGHAKPETPQSKSRGASLKDMSTSQRAQSPQPLDSKRSSDGSAQLGSKAHDEASLSSSGSSGNLLETGNAAVKSSPSTGDVRKTSNEGLSKNNKDSSTTSSSGNLDHEHINSASDTDNELRSLDSAIAQANPLKATVQRKRSQKRKRDPNEIDPDLLAEIEAFERMAQNYLKLHGQDFPFY